MTWLSRTTRTGARSLSFLFLLAGSFWLALKVLPGLAARPGDYPISRYMPALSAVGEGAFFVYARGNELSHPVLYYDIGSSIEYARKADILIVGNSRTQLGTSEHIFTTESEQLGIKTFNLAVGHGDRTRFALDLIQRHDLTPKIVIVNGGPFIFDEGYSKWGEEVVAMGPWNARKMVLESTAGWLFTSFLHQHIPRLDYFDEQLTTQWVHYRSVETGWFRNAREPTDQYPVSVVEGPAEYPYALRLAREFKQELDERGTLLVLTTLPYVGTQTEHLEYLSAKLGVPVINLDFEGIHTADGSHLNRQGAERVSDDLWGQFVVIPEVRAALELP